MSANVVLKGGDFLFLLEHDGITFVSEGFPLSAKLVFQDNYVVEQVIRVGFVGGLELLKIGRRCPTSHVGRGSGNGRRK